MSRSLVTKKPVKLPKELEKFFENPPLVGNERPEDYDAVFLAIATVVKPEDVIQWILTREFADISWELQRERQIKAGIIMFKQKEARNPSGMVMTRADFERAKMEQENPSMFQKRVSTPEVRDDESESLP
jgi:hypothetical protein